jgi:predicted  nucleic acid-binding Zn-ribbon protein
MLRHTIEGSTVSFYYNLEEEFEKPVITCNANDLVINDIQATIEMVDELLEIIYNSTNIDVHVTSFELNEATDLLELKQNDETFFNVYLTKYNKDAEIADIVSDLNDEIERAKIAEDDIVDSLNTYVATFTERFETVEENISLLNSKTDVLRENIEDEVVRAENAESNLQDGLNNVSNNLQNEISRATNRENIIDNKTDIVTANLSTETINRIQSDEQLHGELNAISANLTAETERAKTRENEIEKVYEDKITDIGDIAKEAVEIAVIESPIERIKISNRFCT